jgi:hypothetical protein
MCIFILSDILIYNFFYVWIYWHLYIHE